LSSSRGRTALDRRSSLPERAREQVLVLLARLIDAGAVEQEGGR
jgi:hypothetical protein